MTICLGDRLWPVDIEQCRLKNAPFAIGNGLSSASIERFALAMRTGQLPAASWQFAAGNVQVAGSLWQRAAVTSHSLTVSARLAIGKFKLAVGNLHLFSRQLPPVC